MRPLPVAATACAFALTTTYSRQGGQRGRTNEAPPVDRGFLANKPRSTGRESSRQSPRCLPLETRTGGERAVPDLVRAVVHDAERVGQPVRQARDAHRLRGP